MRGAEERGAFQGAPYRECMPMMGPLMQAQRCESGDKGRVTRYGMTLRAYDDENWETRDMLRGSGKSSQEVSEKMERTRGQVSSFRRRAPPAGCGVA